MDNIPIIFSHYGNIDYLSKSLLCASLTNPAKRKILIGDASNRDSALSNGWEHVLFTTLESDLRNDFNKNFSYVHGALHPTIKNQGDWLRYVFERWYFVQEFCSQNKIEKFWHFDSDVLILEDLRIFEPGLVGNYDYTTQCNDMCMNGFVSLYFLSEYCHHMISLFKDDKFIASQQNEFDTIHPDYAFTEMRAYSNFSQIPSLQARFGHLESLFVGWWFDDCICQDDEFELDFHPLASRPIKKINFNKGSFFGLRKSAEVRFAAINLSWVPTSLFDWFIMCILSRQGEREPIVVNLNEWPVN